MDPTKFGENFINPQTNRFLPALSSLGTDIMRWLSSQNILIIGMQGIGAEAAKNLVLTGVGTLTIWDSNSVQVTDFGTNMFLDPNETGSYFSFYFFVSVSVVINIIVYYIWIVYRRFSF
jgi:hypothetical protein